MESPLQRTRINPYIVHCSLRRQTHTCTYRCCPLAAWEPSGSWARMWPGSVESRKAPPGWIRPDEWLWCHSQQSSHMSNSRLDYQRTPIYWSLQHLKILHYAMHKIHNHSKDLEIFFLLSKDALNRSKFTLKAFIMLQIIYIKTMLLFCSFYT